MKHCSVVFLFILCLMPASPLPAVEPLTIEGATQKALSTNPRLQAAKLAALAAGERTKEALSRYFGEVDLVGSYNNYESPRLVRPMSIDLFKDPKLGFYQLPWASNQTHYGIAYEIPLLAAGKLYEGRIIAKFSQSASENLALYTQEEVRYNVRATFRNVLVLKHTLASLKAYEEALLKDAADSDLRVKLSALAPVDAAKVHFALESAKAQRESAAAQLASTEAFLAAFMGEDPPKDGYELVEIPIEPAIPEGSQEDCSRSAVSRRWDLLASKDSVHIAERKKSLAWESFGPQLMIAGNFLNNDGTGLKGSPDTREFGVYVKVPLFEGLQRVFELRAADNELASVVQQERAKELEVMSQVKDALGRLQASRVQYEAGKAQRALGAEVARVEHLKLEKGTGKMEDYLVARTQELQGETGYWQGLYALQSAVDYYDFVCASGGRHE